MDFSRGEDVTILSAPLVTDEYGTASAERDWASAQSTVVRAVIAARSSSEVDNPGRTAVIVGLSVYLPAGTVLTSADRLLVRGETYEVEGEPFEWRSPWSAAPAGVEAALRRVSG